MKNIKRVLAGVLCALLLVQGTPQMAIAMQIQDVNLVTAKGAEHQDIATDTETDGTGESESQNEENQTGETEQQENSGDESSVTDIENEDNENNLENVSNTETSEDSENNENTDTENEEQNEQIENKESTEVISTEDLDDTDLIECIDTTDTQENESDNEGIMLFDAGAGDGNDNQDTIDIKVKLVGAENGDSLDIKYKSNTAVSVDTTGKELKVSAGEQLELYITNLNGLKIKEVKWESAENEQIIATEITDNKIVIKQEQLVANANIIIGVEYYKFPICLKGATDKETLERIELKGDVTELTYTIDDTTGENVETQGKNHTFQLVGQTAVEVPMYWSTEGARMVFGDLNGLKLEKVVIQYEKKTDRFERETRK